MNEVHGRNILGSKIVQTMFKKVQLIKDGLKVAQSNQDSYVDNQRAELNFQVGEHMFLKESPIKGMVR